MRLYRRMLAEEGLDCEWESRGLLFVFQSPRELEHYAQTDRLLRETFGMPAVRYDADALVELEPALKPGTVAGAWHYEGDAHLRPDRLMSELRRVLERRQVVVRENCEVTGLVRENGRAAAVETPQGRLPADVVVVATGAWTPQLNRILGCRVPIQPGKGYSITMPRPARCPKIPMIFHEHRVAVTPFASGYRLGSTMEFAGYDDCVHPRRLALLTSAARLFLEEPTAEPVLEEWCGWRPMTSDSKPIIDRSPEMSNVLIAAGHNMLGLSMAPAPGKRVAELAGGQPPHLPLGAYSLARF
jgi:D-amino-acid dehydrogenase